MRKPVVLFGAGASIDAGLPNTWDLTEIIYKKLRADSATDARLFGFVIAKLIARNARRGNSPFDKVNVEEAYDALKRLLAREADVLSEFVYSWDPITKPVPQPFDSGRFLRELANLFSLSARRSLSGDTARIKLDDRSARRLAKVIKDAFEQPESVPPDLRLSNYLTLLGNVLEPETPKLDYLCEFLERTRGKIECIATLNYDGLVEKAAKQCQLSVDHGLKSWNQRRYVRFLGSDVKLIKLHGSIHWHFESDDEIVEGEPGAIAVPAIIFGGQGDKLSPRGPFLHLRQEFQRFLRNSNALVVIGYSFSDEHLNAVLRSWVSTRLKAKLIIVDPNGYSGGPDIIRHALGTQGSKMAQHKLEIQIVRGGFKEKMEEILRSLDKPPNPANKESQSFVIDQVRKHMQARGTSPLFESFY